MKWYFHSESMDKELEVKAIFLDTNKFTVQLNGWGTECLYGADKLLQAHDDAVRRECAEKAKRYIQGLGDQSRSSEILARGVCDEILGTEPAREGS